MRTLGTLTVDGQRKTLTDYDYEWALKATLGEAGGNPDNKWEWGAVLWTMLHRWVGNYGRAGESFGEYIQRFSQPVNPRQIGKVHAYDRTESDPSGLERSQARDARIRANRARPVAEIVQRYPELAAYVLKFVQGKIPRGPYALFADFAAPYAGHAASDVPVGQGKGNAFYAESWIHDLRLKFDTTGLVVAAGITLLAIGAGVGYYFWLKAKQRTATGFGDARSARLRAGRLHCPYCEGEIECEMPPRICGPEDAAPTLFKLIGADKRTEAFWVFLLDHQMNIVEKKRIALGGPESVSADPRGVFRTALVSPKPVGGIITVHNHTVGDSTPSQPDLDVTHAAVTIGHLMQIPIIDHIVIGSTGEYTSIRDYVEERYGEGAFIRTMITPGGEAPRPKLIAREGRSDVKGLFGSGFDIG